MSFFTLSLYIFCIIIRPQDWVPGVYGWPLVNILAICTFFLLSFENLAVNKKGFIKVPQNKLMIGLFCCVILSHVSNTYFAGAVNSTKEFGVLALLYFLVLNGVNTSKKLKMITWILIFLITILVFQGIYQLEHGYGWAGQPPYIHGGDTTEFFRRIKWVGIFDDPNDLALIFVMASGLTLPFLLGRSTFFGILISIGILGLLFYGVYLTNSRGGMLALMATIYYFMVRKTRNFTVGGIFGGIFAFVILILGPSRMGALSTAESSAYSRVQLWYDGLLLLKSNPVFGVGHGMFMNALPQTAHNSFILAAAELGFLGLFCWIGLIYISIKGLMVVQNNSKHYYNYALGLQSSIIGFSAAAFFLSRTYTVIPYLLFSMAGALMRY